MGAKEKREKERAEAINKRKKEVIEAAKVIFAEKSIEKATMQDIAEKAEVGVASVYRYYATKIVLVMEVAKDYLENDFSYKDIQLVGIGIEQTSQIMDYYSKKFNDQPGMMVFMEQLDSFIMSCDKETVPLETYEELITGNIALLTRIIEKGKEDGSIRLDIKSEEIGYTFLNLFITLAQKLLLREQMLQPKTNVTWETLKIYKEMLLKYLKAA